MTKKDRNQPLKPHAMRRVAVTYRFEGDTPEKAAVTPSTSVLDMLVRTEAQRIAFHLRTESDDPEAVVALARLLEKAFREFYPVAEDYIRRVGAKFDGEAGGKSNRDQGLWDAIVAALTANGADAWERGRPELVARQLTLAGHKVSRELVVKVRRVCLLKPPKSTKPVRTTSKGRSGG